MKRSKSNRRKPKKRALPKLPSLPRPAINWRACAAIAVSIGVVAIGASLGRELLEMPVKQMDIKGNFQRVTKLQIQTAAAEAIAGTSFLNVDLDQVRRRVAAIDWVDTVRLQRVWPDKLRVTYTEHRAAARWGDNGLLNTGGQLFAQGVRQEYNELPRLDGPEGSHARVAARYLEIRDAAAGANLMLDRVSMDDRGAYTIEFVGGLKARIGREDISRRIERLFDVAVPHLGTRLADAAYIDMRYPSAFAVGWQNLPEPETQLAGLGSSG